MPAQPLLERHARATPRAAFAVPSRDAVAPAVNEVHALARQLIQSAVQQPPSNISCVNEHEVLLDVELDGFRCLLIRLPPPLPATPAEHTNALSPRELEIARMIAKGYPNKTIAAILEISAWTVCTHIRRIFAKLNVGSRAAMVARLGEDGLLVNHPAAAASNLGLT